MHLDAYLKSVLTVIAVALVAIAVHLWAERVSPAPAQAQTASRDAVTNASGAAPPTPMLEPIARRLSAIEHTQKEQAQRLEALRSALQSTVTRATRRGYFPDGNWSTVFWDPDVPPAAGG